MNGSLIKIKKFDKNNSTTYTYNVTERYSNRLQWLGGAGVVSFVLNNLTRRDSNSYIMVMSFGGAREPINDHFELVVTCKYMACFIDPFSYSRLLSFKVSAESVFHMS